MQDFFNNFCDKDRSLWCSLEFHLSVISSPTWSVWCWFFWLLITVLLGLSNIWVHLNHLSAFSNVRTIQISLTKILPRNILSVQQVSGNNRAAIATYVTLLSKFDSRIKNANNISLKRLKTTDEFPLLPCQNWILCIRLFLAIFGTRSVKSMLFTIYFILCFIQNTDIKYMNTNCFYSPITVNGHTWC